MANIEQPSVLPLSSQEGKQPKFAVEAFFGVYGEGQCACCQSLPGGGGGGVKAEGSPGCQLQQAGRGRVFAGCTPARPPIARAG